MRRAISLLLVTALCASGNAEAAELSAADVVVLGEIHDNSAHHATQLEWLALVQPTAVIYEMLTASEAAMLADVPRDPDVMERTAQEGFHWSGLDEYANLLAASPEIIGAALPREKVRAAIDEGAAAVFGADAGRFGLTLDLPTDQLEIRADVQFKAHCGALPRDMMRGMVEAQRLRDAALARTVLDALDRHGPPVVLITGNGHARKDWGVPVVLAAVRPELEVFSLGQTEDGAAISGDFDAIADAARPERADPCAAFK